MYLRRSHDLLIPHPGRQAYRANINQRINLYSKDELRIGNPPRLRLRNNVSAL